MDIFVKTIAGILVSLIACLILSQHGKNFSLLLTVLTCCGVAVICFTYLERVIDFIGTLQTMGDLNGEYISVLLKCIGIAVLSEITSMICTDCGNGALAKVTQMLAAAIILWFCIPLYSTLLELVESVLLSI